MESGGYQNTAMNHNRATRRPPGGVTPNPVRSRNRIRRPIKKAALVILTIPAAGKQQKAQIITAGRGRNSLFIA